MTRRRGLVIGQQSRNVKVVLEPWLSLSRMPQGADNWRGFGADPFLTGELAYETVLGIQKEGVQACASRLLNKYV